MLFETRQPSILHIPHSMKNVQSFRVHRAMPASLLFLLICLMAGCTKTETKPDDPASNIDKYWQKASLPPMPVGSTVDGRVLVACGPAYTSTQIYDPATDKWTVASSVSPEYGEDFIRLKSGKMVLLSRGSSIVQVYDPAKGWMSPGTMSGQAGDRNTVSGACELQNGRVVLVGMSSIAVWDQNKSFIVYKMNYGSGAFDYATVHQLPGTNQFVIFGNALYEGQGIIYELDIVAGNRPKEVSDVLPISGITLKSVETNSGLIFLAGGSKGTNFRNGPLAPHLFNPADKTFTSLGKNLSVGNPGGGTTVGKDQAGNVWFTDDYIRRYRVDAATQKVTEVTQDATLPTPSPFGTSDIRVTGARIVFLNDGRLMAFNDQQAWITK